MSPAPLVALFLLASGASAMGPGDVDTAVLRWEPRCIMHALAQDVADVIGRHRGPEFERRLRAAGTDPDLPALRLESRTPVEHFRAALARQYADGGQPDRAREAGGARFSNMYAAASNQVFLIDSKELYERLGAARSIDDSLAHEYVHFLQVRYYGYSVADLARDHSAEAMAVEYQQNFRERYVRTGQAPPCP